MLVTSRNRKKLLTRFMAKVDRAGECWVWQAKLDNGYGLFWIGDRETGRSYRAHRVSYELFGRTIPEGLTLDHLCRNRACVNPAHLQPVDAVENVMRGESFSARNARKTHCPRGHEYTPENTYIQPQGWRCCKTCQRARRGHA